MSASIHAATWGWCMDPSHHRGPCSCQCHTDHTAADECRDEFRDDVERELREYGVELP
jgi:hypothetical protein